MATEKDALRHLHEALPLREKNKKNAVQITFNLPEADYSEVRNHLRNFLTREGLQELTQAPGEKPEEINRIFESVSPWERNTPAGQAKIKDLIAAQAPTEPGIEENQFFIPDLSAAGLGVKAEGTSQIQVLLHENTVSNIAKKLSEQFTVETRKTAIRDPHQRMTDEEGAWARAHSKPSDTKGGGMGTP